MTNLNSRDQWVADNMPQRNALGFEVGERVHVRTDPRGAWVVGTVETKIFTSPPTYHIQTDDGLIENTRDVKP